MKHQIFFLFFFASLTISPLYSASTDSLPLNKKYQMCLKLLETIVFSGSEQLLNITYEQEDISAYIARHFVPQGSVISIEPNENLAEQATHDYSGINNLHIVTMDASYFNFCKSLDIILSIFPDDWLEQNSSIKQVIKNITQSLKSGGFLYLCLDGRKANKRALIMQTLIESNEYFHVCYHQNDVDNFCLVTAQKK